jgi:hypothetical protein
MPVRRLIEPLRYCRHKKSSPVKGRVVKEWLRSSEILIAVQAFHGAIENNRSQEARKGSGRTPFNEPTSQRQPLLY